MTTAVVGIRDRARRESKRYSGDEERPLGGYAAGLGIYSTAVAGLSLLARKRGRSAPELTPYEVTLLAIATHKVARTISKDNVTSVLRAPFTRYAGTGGPAELHEEVRGHGVKHAVGELLTCPFCLAQWTATSFAFGMVFAPRVTRLAAATMTAVAGADFLQLAYAWAQQRAEG